MPDTVYKHVHTFKNANLKNQLISNIKLFIDYVTIKDTTL